MDEIFAAIGSTGTEGSTAGSSSSSELSSSDSIMSASPSSSSLGSGGSVEAGSAGSLMCSDVALADCAGARAGATRSTALPLSLGGAPVRDAITFGTDSGNASEARPMRSQREPG